MGESIEDELERLKRERDNRLHADLAKLSASIDHLSSKIDDMAPQKELDDIDDRLTSLENYKWMIIGGFTAIASMQAVQAFMLWFINQSKS